MASLDDRLRSLQRRWNETGAAEDEAAYHLERVRAGELDERRLALAAYCGHPAAALASKGDPAPGRPELLQLRVYGLEPWGREVWTRAAVIAAEAVLPHFVAEFPDVDEVPGWIRFARDWLAGTRSERPGEWSPYPPRPQPEAEVAIDALEPVCSDACDGAFRAARLLRDVDGDRWDQVSLACDVLVAAQDAMGDAVWDAVAAELARWALS